MERRFSNPLLSIFQAIVDLIFPPACLHCNARISRQQDYLCDSCEKALTPLPEPVCEVCGYPILDDDCAFCSQHEGDLPYDKAVSLFQYEGPTRTLIHYLKFGDMPGIAFYLGRKAIALIRERKLFPDASCITSIPLHRVRFRERGYNQSGLLASSLADGLRYTHKPSILSRSLSTLPQANLLKAKRLANVEGVFKVKKSVDLKQENILLLDDVFTTGATVQSACKELRKAHPGKIYVFTIGRA